SPSLPNIFQPRAREPAAALVGNGAASSSPPLCFLPQPPRPPAPRPRRRPHPRSSPRSSSSAATPQRASAPTTTLARSPAPTASPVDGASAPTDPPDASPTAASPSTTSGMHVSLTQQVQQVEDTYEQLALALREAAKSICSRGRCRSGATTSSSTICEMSRACRCNVSHSPMGVQSAPCQCSEAEIKGGCTCR
uniref:Uncharacterized protein n=1 Tax=Aegilops tauschii subsp. strangulata TaxID=200361 RepID=A0A452Z4T4_AEGTS